MLNSALQGETPLLFSDLDPSAHCVFCGRPRPVELLVTWMCSRCKCKPLFEILRLFWARRQES